MVGGGKDPDPAHPRRGSPETSCPRASRGTLPTSAEGGWEIGWLGLAPSRYRV